jgi:hypothetical protein
MGMMLMNLKNTDGSGDGTGATCRYPPDDIASRPSASGTPMRRARSVLLTAAMLLLVCRTATAAYDANMAGELEGFYVYAESDYIYFRLKNQPASHNGCNPAYFVIPATVPVERRKAMLVRLSLAYALQESVNIGYAANGDCANGYINVHRVG